MKGANLLHPIFMPPVAVVIGGITIHKAIGKHEIDRGVMPFERSCTLRLRFFQQQKTVTFRCGLQGDFPVAYRGGLLAVEIAYQAAFREGVANRHGQRLIVTHRTLARWFGRRIAGLAFDTEQQRWCAGAGIELYLIIAITEYPPLRSTAAARLQRKHLVQLDAAGGLPALLTLL